MQRFVVTTLPSENRQSSYLKYVILDRETCGYLTRSEGDNVLPLEWPTRAGAESWLYKCYREWDSGRIPAPKGWRPFAPIPSPWA